MNHQPSDDPNLFVRLARTLLGGVFDRSANLVTGRVPDGWPNEIVPPLPATTLGGVSRGNMLTVVFSYPADVASPVAEFRALLERNGWTHSPRGPADGFEIALVATMRRESFVADVTHAGGDDNAIIVKISQSEGVLRRALMPRLNTITVPRLVAPAGVRSEGGGGGGGDDHTHRRMRVVTDLPAHELLAVYAKQLGDAGWKLGEKQATPTSATQWLETVDDRGQTWRGLLVVYANAPACEVLLYVATAAPESSSAMRS